MEGTLDVYESSTFLLSDSNKADVQRGDPSLSTLYRKRGQGACGLMPTDDHCPSCASSVSVCLFKRFVNAVMCNQFPQDCPKPRAILGANPLYTRHGTWKKK